MRSFVKTTPTRVLRTFANYRVGGWEEGVSGAEYLEWEEHEFVWRRQTKGGGRFEEEPKSFTQRAGQNDWMESEHQVQEMEKLDKEWANLFGIKSNRAALKERLRVLMLSNTRQPCRLQRPVFV
ncbi:hypothetical protein DMENIID0001_156320 [Sergentomyia squamirostris]